MNSTNLMTETILPRESAAPVQPFPPFTVIIPARNAGLTLGPVLDSIFRATLQPAQVIVVNDGSTDVTPVIASAYPCEQLHVSIQKGPMEARFAGIGSAAHSLLVFVDADVCVKPDTFERLLAHFKNPEVHAVTGLLSKGADHENFFSAFKNEYMNFIFRKQPASSRFIYGSLWAIRSQDLSVFVPTSSPFGSAVSDSEFGLLLRRRGKKIILDRALEVDHLKRYHFTSLLLNDFKIPFLFALLLVKYGWTPSARKAGKFSHASFGQVAANALAFFTLYALIPVFQQKHGPWLSFAAAALAAVFFYWRKFLAGLVRRRGLVFLIKALFFILLDGAIMFVGMNAGLVYAAIRSLQTRLGRFLYVRKLKHSHF